MKKLICPLLIMASIIYSCTNANNEKAGVNTTEANKAKMQEFYDKIMNAHDPSMIDEYVIADFVEHQPFPGQAPGREGLKAAFKDFFAAYPDLKVKSNFMTAFGDTVMVHMTMTGTQTGPFMGMPATNKQINVDGVDIVVIKDGKATEHWGYMEEMKMMEQLGMGPGAAPENSQPTK